MQITKTITALVALTLMSISNAQTNVTPISQLNTEQSIPGSHFGETSTSSLELDFRTKVTLGIEELGWKNLHYPRIKQLKDGSFFMMYQPARISKNIFGAHSVDGLNWTQAGKVFTSVPTVNGYGVKDLLCYSSADCLVLSNGDILAFSPFRTEKGYKMIPEDNGIAIVRSRDGGHTWEGYQVIFVGQNWEPFAMELESGEIQVYFTDSDPEFKGSSAGVSLLRSFDGGDTWTQQCYISRHFKGMALDQKNNVMARAYCDQMPSVCTLGDGKTKFMAMESVQYEDDDTSKEKTYMLSFVWNDDNWKDTIKGDQTGPERKVDHAFRGCAPYVGYFPSGETILSYNRERLYFRVGNEKADNFADALPYSPFEKSYGYWGSFEILDDHSLFAAIPHLYDSEKMYRKITIGRLYLNHMIDVNEMTPVLDGGEADWSDNTDALFVGSNGQAQSTFRFAQDAENVYVLVGLRDSLMCNDDMVRLMFGDGSSTSSTVEVNLPYNSHKVSLSCRLKVKLSSTHFPGEGFIAEVAIPKSRLSFAEGRLYFNADLIKKDAGYVDGFTNVKSESPQTWIPLVF
jgi:hypothetical protein